MINLQEWVLEPITRSVGRQLARRFMESERMSQLLAYRHLASVPESRPLAGIIFESMGQLQLQRQIALNLVQMVKLPSVNGKKSAQWTSVPAPNLVSTAPISIHFTPESTVEYEDPLLSEFQPGVYYVPRSSKQVVFHSFIMVDQILYVFQFLIASSYPIASTMDFFSQSTLDTMLQGMEWRFVFIIPPGGTILCPQESGARFEGLWERVRLFSAVFDPEKDGVN